MCQCDVALHQIITECYEQNKTVVREGTFWITHLVNTTDNSSTNKYLIYPHCPLDYCHPPTSKVYINLSRMELMGNATSIVQVSYVEDVNQALACPLEDHAVFLAQSTGLQFVH